MKLIDKIKNYFYDEEDPNESKKEAPKAEPSKGKAQVEIKEEKKEKTVENVPNLDVISERELFKSEPTFNFPIVFDDEDFKEPDVKTSRITSPKKEQTKKEEKFEQVEKIEKKAFIPSPNISPVYGVIREQAEDSASKHEDSDNLLNLYDDNKKVDIDDVLGRVYEQTRVEIKQERYEEVTAPKPILKDDLSLDIFDNNEEKKITREQLNSKKEVKIDTTDEVDKKLKTIDELLENTSEDDFYSLVDSMYKNESEEGDN